MSGVTNFIREFSESFEEMNSWKYTVEMTDDGVEIKYWEIDYQSENKELKVTESFIISNLCAEVLFKTIARDFTNHNFDI